jgi:hypothetical protein
MEVRLVRSDRLDASAPVALGASNLLHGVNRRLVRPALIGLVLLLALAFVGNALATPAPVGLGTTGTFAILAGTAITDVPASSIVGDVGVSPAAGSFMGLGCSEVVGTIYSVDPAGPLPCRVTNPALLTTAKTDLTNAYGDAAGRTPDTTLGAADNQLGGQTLVAGVYRFPHATTANLIGALTLSGSASDVWIFQATSDLVTAVGSSVNFTGGASACNVFWQVPSSATLNGSSFAGTVMAAASVTIGNGLALSGRALASTGNVTLIQDTISVPNCAAAPVVPPVVVPPVVAPVADPSHEIYCDPSGRAYELVVGQDKEAPYNTLGLVPAYVDPLTGSKSCTFPIATPTPPPVAAPVRTAAPVKAKPAHRKPVPVKKGVAGAHVTRVVKTHHHPHPHPRARPAVRRVALLG